ncbi:MAG: hypothetical protein OXI33_04210 [Chloroflexota bacterium]|nr:hypothetical protein [Chloroflexota bacterium]
MTDPNDLAMRQAGRLEAIEGLLAFLLGEFGIRKGARPSVLLDDLEEIGSRELSPAFTEGRLEFSGNVLHLADLVYDAAAKPD